MTFSPEVTLGNILSIVAFLAAVIGAFYGLKGKMDVFVVMMAHNNDRFQRMEQRHEQRLTKLEDNDQRLTSIVQQLIGQNAERDRWDGNDRRENPRRRSNHNT